MADNVEYYTGQAAEDVVKMINSSLTYARQFWRPLHLRQDYWASMYMLLDVVQQSKPLGRRRFVSNEPRTSVDAALSILTRNEIKWRSDLTRDEDEDENTRLTVGKVERTLSGLIYDVDDLFASRGEPPFWKQVALQGLLRGWIWAKGHITTEALKYINSPIISEVYDARTVYPLFDQFGLNRWLAEKLCTAGDLVMLYPDQFGELGEKKDFNPWAPAVKVEFWSNTRNTTPGITCTLASVGFSDAMVLANPLSQGAKFVIPPYEHGYTPDALPVVGVPVNGTALRSKPELTGTLAHALSEKADLLGLQMLSWHGPGTWVADSGRSILSCVEDQMPQYNELVATIFQHLTSGTYPTWVFKNRTGEPPPEFTGGLNEKIALRLEESAQRIDPVPISPDAYRLMQLLSEERQKGVLSNVLHAVGPFQGLETGIALQQVANTALNAIEPYDNGLKQFGIRFGGSILKQMQLAAGELQPFEVVTPTPKRTYFRIEFDPKTDLDQKRRYRVVPQPNPAVPDDLIVRLQAARLALDPRRPLLSLVTVLETILRQEDPAGEVNRIWEDIAQTDPVIVAEQIADAMERLNEPAMAARMRETEFRSKLIEDLRFRQITGGIPQLGGQPPGPGPETGAPTATQRTGTGSGQAGGGMEGEGAALLGALGETMNP